MKKKPEKDTKKEEKKEDKKEKDKSRGDSGKEEEKKGKKKKESDATETKKEKSVCDPRDCLLSNGDSCPDAAQLPTNLSRYRLSCKLVESEMKTEFLTVNFFFCK